MISRLFTICIIIFAWGNGIYAQTPEGLLAEAKALERKFKEPEAIDKYSEVLVIQPSNLQATVKIAELWANIARRAEKIFDLNQGLKKAREFANKAMQLDSGSVEALWVKAYVHRHFAETEFKKDDAAEELRQWKIWAEKALAVDSSHFRTKHLLAQWHLEVITQGGLRTASVKILYGGLPKPDINKAVSLMEAVKQAEPYYAANFLDLGRAYNYLKRYELAIQTLDQLAKLPTRRLDDVKIKEEGKLLRLQLQ